MNLVENDRRHHDETDPHVRGRWLSSVLLGGQDGVVNVLGVVLGVVAATHQTRIVLAAGMAAAFAESISMAAVAYTASVAEGELYRSERAREYRHLEAVPGLEREEVRLIYSRRGFSGELLDRIVETITANKDVWVAVMMSEEHGLADVDRRKSARAAIVVGIASVIGSFIPLVPFFLFSTRAGAWASSLLAALALFAFGAYKAKITIGSPVKAGFELAAIGILSALIGYGIGALFQVQ
jgi:predicted membrane protein (TIGR00267 family)